MISKIHRIEDGLWVFAEDARDLDKIKTGETYKVIQEHPSHYSIKGSDGEVYKYSKWRFRVVVSLKFKLRIKE